MQSTSCQMLGWMKRMLESRLPGEISMTSDMHCLENPRDRGAWWAAVYGVAQSWTQLKWLSSSSSRYADNITLMAESEEELKSLLMKVKEETEKVGLKLNIRTTKIMASNSITSCQIDGETMKTVTDFFAGGLQNHCRWWLQPWN